MSKEELVHTGIYFPVETLKKLDERRGRYYSRNRYLLKIVDEHLSENVSKNVQGPKGSTPLAQAPPHTPTSTNNTNTTNTGTPEVDSVLRDMATSTRGSRRLGGDEAVDASRR